MDTLLQNIFISVICIGLFLFAVRESNIAKELIYIKKGHTFKIFLIYFIGLLLIALNAYFPEYIYPFPVLAVALVLFGNFNIAVAAYTSLIVLLSISEQFFIALFLIYYLPGIIAIFLYKKIDKNFRRLYPQIIINCSFIVLTVSYLFLYRSLPEYELWIKAGISLLLAIVLQAVLIGLFYRLVIHKYDAKYDEINDPEYDLLVQLKEKNKEEYYKAVHTAYLSDKIARRLNLDVVLAKAGGYYHRIGVIEGEENYKKNGQKLGVDAGFPPCLLELMQEYAAGNPNKKETAIVILSEAVVSSIIHFSKKQNDKGSINHAQIIKIIFDKKREKGGIDNSKITLKEYRDMQRYFIEEDLYYDFLR